jgi:hypothetical protein
MISTARAVLPAFLVFLTALLMTGCARLPDAQRQSGCEACSGAGASRLSSADGFEDSRRQHLADCLAGGRCKFSALTPAEQAQVTEVLARLNHEACLRGERTCRSELLSPDQEVEVARVARSRNFEFCRSGLTACDPLLLTEAERAQVRAAYDERNFRGCMNSVGTLLPCVREDLSPEQREQVRVRDQNVNFWLCLNQVFGCREDLLPDAQRAEIARRRAAGL